MAPEEGSGGYDAAVQRLTALINSHYRPKGSDAEGTFRKMPLWLEVRHTCAPAGRVHQGHDKRA